MRRSGAWLQSRARASSLEMTACAALAEGKRNALMRVDDHGAGPLVVQLAGCEARWMAEGARIAEGAGAAIIDINMGCPASMSPTASSGWR